ncbi:MAG TPA: methionine--tRNA ligase subunit beta, partial [Pyrinomonadaceae bacterium]
IDPVALHRHVGNDAVRYFLLREMSFGQDCNVGYESIIDRANSDLASGLGNLVSRTLTMIKRYCDGAVPAGEIPEEQRLSAKRAGVDTDAQSLATVLEHARNQFVAGFDELAYHRALESVWGAISRVDKLISESKPWELAKDEKQRPALGAVLYRAAESLRWLAALLYPVMPESAASIWRQLGQTTDITKTNPTELTWGGLREGTLVGDVAPLFPRLDKKKIMDTIEEENAQKNAPAETRATQAAVPGSEAAAETKPAPPAPGATEADAVPPAAKEKAADAGGGLITIDDFVKVELRVAQVLTAERVPKADRLLRLTVDVGEESPRQILAGIALHYEPESLLGRKIIVVSNLQPRKLRGLESQGMLLAASAGDEGKPILATFAEDVPNGTKLK